MPPDGLVIDVVQWDASDARWCGPSGLDGTIFDYEATSSSSSFTVDPVTKRVTLTAVVAAGGYAGGGIKFGSCVDASAFAGIQFTAAVTGGSLAGCAWQVLLQTQDQRPQSLTNPTGGTCTNACYTFPKTASLPPPGTGTTYKPRFTAFDNPTGSTIPAAQQVIGFQWNLSAAGGGCSVVVRFDDIGFLPP